jgi:hypothetical protein
MKIKFGDNKMFTKKSLIKLLSLVVSSILILTSLPNALAATASGVNISNQATVDYEINSVNQTDVNSNPVTFMVDTKVDLTVTAAVNVNGTPGYANHYALQFTITNTGNETFDFSLALEAGVEEFTATDLAIHIDNGNGTWDGIGTDLLGTLLEDIAPDTPAVVWLIGKIPTTATDNQSATYNLIATSLLADGAPIPAEEADVVTTKQYVYADGDGPHSGDAVRDTKHSDALAFVAQTADLTITKTSSVIWDPVNTTTNPLHIPGAIIEYSIQIDNGAGAETANAVIVTDVLDTNLAMPTDDARKYAAGSSIQLTTPNLYGGSATALTDTSDTDEATVSGQTVTVTNIVLTGGQSATVRIRAEIQ